MCATKKIYFFVFLDQNPIVFSSCKTKYDVYSCRLEPSNFNQ